MADAVSVPAGLAGISRLPGGAAWLRSLPAVVATVVRDWGLDLGDPYPDCGVSWVAPAERRGVALVLKVQYPHREAEGEADALRAWDGRGAIRLVDHDAGRHALLLERCSPGTHLAAATGTDGVGVLCRLLPDLWVPPPAAVGTLHDEAGRWADELAAAAPAVGPEAQGLVDLARRFLDGLRREPGPPVLVHQDLHGDNVLAARRRPWLAIDPKPLAGEREFSVAPVVRSFEFGHSRAAVTQRLARLCVELGLDEERAARWTVAQTVAWSFDSAFAERHLETAGWLADHLGEPFDRSRG